MESVERVACLFARCSSVARPPAPNDMDNGIRFWSEWNRRTDGWHGAMAGPKSEDNFSLSAFLQWPFEEEEEGRERAKVPPTDAWTGVRVEVSDLKGFQACFER